MNNIKAIKVLVSLGFIILYVLPIINKELYVEKYGKINNPDIILVILIIFGLFQQWRYLKELLILLMVLGFISTLFFILLNSSPVDEIFSRPGWIINAGIDLIIFLLLLKLKKVENN